MVQAREYPIFKTPFARVATALWSLALLLVVLLLFLLPGKPPTAAVESAPTARASAASAEKVADSSPMLEASVHATAKDKLD